MSEAEAIVKREETLPGIPEELQGYTGIEGLDPSTFVIPRVKIVQPTSKEGTPGTFQMNLTKEEFSEITLTPIKAESGRVLWDDDSDADEPLCRSYNGHTPDPQIEKPPSLFCTKLKDTKSGKVIYEPACPHAHWGPNKERPDCDQVYNLLCIQSEDGLPFWLQISGTSITNFKKFVSAVALRRKRLFEFKSTISLRKETFTKGVAYILEFSPPAPLTVEELTEISTHVISLKDETVARSIQAEDAAGKEEDDIPI